MWKPIILDVECIVCNKSLQKINHDPREVTRKMGKITNRRSRTPNWSPDEKQYLLELIKERKDVVVIKTTNGPNHYEEKDIAWNEILCELESKFGNKFTGSSIKKVKTQWQNMKRIAREEITLNGPEVQKYSRQSLEVCFILDLVKDGVLKREDENIALNDTAVTNNVEIKTERIDEDISQPSGSGTDSFMDIEHEEQQKNDSPHSNIPNQQASQFESPASSMSGQASENVDFEPEQSTEYAGPRYMAVSKRTVSANTEGSYFENLHNVNTCHRELQEFCRYTSVEKQLKMETLKEERQVIRAMRETAELNKIIAEQRLKHVLWVKKQEMK